MHILYPPFMIGHPCGDAFPMAVVLNGGEQAREEIIKTYRNDRYTTLGVLGNDPVDDDDVWDYAGFFDPLRPGFMNRSKIAVKLLEVANPWKVDHPSVVAQSLHQPLNNGISSGRRSILSALYSDCEWWNSHRDVVTAIEKHAEADPIFAAACAVGSPRFRYVTEPGTFRIPGFALIDDPDMRDIVGLCRILYYLTALPRSRGVLYADVRDLSPWSITQIGSQARTGCTLPILALDSIPDDLRYCFGYGVMTSDMDETKTLRAYEDAGIDLVIDVR